MRVDLFLLPKLLLVLSLGVFFGLFVFYQFVVKVSTVEGLDVLHVLPSFGLLEVQQFL